MGEIKNQINLLENSDFTVIAKYDYKERTNKGYQLEKELEESFIKNLQELGYEYAYYITNKYTLKKNLKEKIEKLNNRTFSENEWSNIENVFFSGKTIQEKTKIIQENYIETIHLDSGEIFNVKIIDKQSIFNNSLQIINQYNVTDGEKKNRYDCTILVNGLPLIHIELKKRGVSVKNAFHQINRYHQESFFEDGGYFDFIQLFVISNGTETKYYSNTIRDQHVQEQNKLSNLDISEITQNKGQQSFEFTNYWSDQNNELILDLEGFTRHFFNKKTILNLLVRYCVFNKNQELLVMRPYQITACEKILQAIKIGYEQRCAGSKDNKFGGYIFHSTGSGKTLTSFKTSQLANELILDKNKNEKIKKVLFVVDRKDLDHQTVLEYEKFKEGCSVGNSSTKELLQQLNDENATIIITTIQKLSILLERIKREKQKLKIFNENVVIIIDECHRSQFGEMHAIIKEMFKKEYIFGFTGTPIFQINSSKANKINNTTQSVFGQELHRYSLINAIQDKNVLPFKVEYHKNVITNQDGEEINKEIKKRQIEKYLGNQIRITEITKYILKSFNNKTCRTKELYSNKFVHGFNALFATSSIETAKKYYEEFKKQQEGLDKKLKIGIIYSYSTKTKDINGIIEENEDNTSTEGLSDEDKKFLEYSINDFNEMFGTTYGINSRSFEQYYKDVSKRVKNRELDLLIVVNMFLTGFDARTLNTLFVDKELQYHGLIQAFSRTNRILNELKRFGQIICFRNLEKETQESIELFSNPNGKDGKNVQTIIIRSFEDQYNGYVENGGKVKGYFEQSTDFKEKFPVNKRIVLLEDKKEFIREFNDILDKRRNLKTYDDFEGKDVFEDGEIQDYSGIYKSILEDLKELRERKEIQDEDFENFNFKLELIKEIDISLEYIYEVQKNSRHLSEEEKKLFKKRIDNSVQFSGLSGEIFESINNNESPEICKIRIQEKFNTEIEELSKEENLDINELNKIFNKLFSGVKENIFEGNWMKNLYTPTSIQNDENLNCFEIYKERQRLKEKLQNKILKLKDKYIGYLQK